MRGQGALKAEVGLLQLQAGRTSLVSSGQGSVARRNVRASVATLHVLQSRTLDLDGASYTARILRLE